MGLLYDAALAWHGLQNVNYFLLLGRSKKWSSALFLDFSLGDFPHLAGMQYARDVDFDVNPAELRGEKLISKIIGGEIDDTLIEMTFFFFGIQVNAGGFADLFFKRILLIIP